MDCNERRLCLLADSHDGISVDAQHRGDFIALLKLACKAHHFRCFLGGKNTIDNIGVLALVGRGSTAQIGVTLVLYDVIFLARFPVAPRQTSVFSGERTICTAFNRGLLMLIVHSNSNGFVAELHDLIALVASSDFQLLGCLDIDKLTSGNGVNLLDNFFVLYDESPFVRCVFELFAPYTIYYTQNYAVVKCFSKII